MTKLVYSAIASLDGFVNDAGGGFGWAAPDAQVHSFVNDIERAVGTHLLGRRMYEVMKVWDGDYGAAATDPPVARDFAAMWRAADKVVFSRTLETVTTPRTELVRDFEPERVRRLLAASDRDVSVGGPTLAADALRSGLVDEVHLTLCPVAVGGGTPVWPTGVATPLTLLDVRRFDSGFVHLHYRCDNRRSCPAGASRR